MSIGSYTLGPIAVYDPRVAFDLKAFRELLREERESRVGGREKLAEKVGVNKTTIQNAESGPDMPGIETVARIVEGMPGLTLSKFFTILESRQTNTDDKDELRRAITPLSSLPNPKVDGGADTGLRAPEYDERFEQRVLAVVARHTALAAEDAPRPAISIALTFLAASLRSTDPQVDPALRAEYEAIRRRLAHARKPKDTKHARRKR